jgi:gamma-glutamyltranspeptidase/glutathione hydrolase
MADRTPKPAVTAVLLLGAAMTAPGPARSADVHAVPPSRPDVSGTEAALTADHPLAVAAGADVLRRGGNAMDAAITMAGVLAVVRPHMCGVGGDFLLYRDGKTGQVHALNGSGRAGARATPELLAERKLERMPSQGPLTVTVPGAPRAWADALERFGTLSLGQALAPAIRHARDGFAVSARFALDVKEERAKLAKDPELAKVYLSGSTAPAVGSLLRQPDLARTLEALAKDGADVLYKGELARRLAAFMEKERGTLTAKDLAGHRSSWQDPIETLYRGRRLLAFPPNTQGVTFLEMMNLAEAADLAAAGHNTAGYVQGWVRVKRLAYADRDRYVADPAFADVPVARLLSKDHARARWRESDGDGTPAVAGPDGSGDTVYLSVVDKQGNAVSLIQSLFAAFGSGRMLPGTGIVLHNRGALFTLAADHPNRIAPGKRPYHTLCPAMAVREDGTLDMVFGSPGGDGQPQTLVQVFHNLAVFGMTPQQAVEAPRFRHLEDGRLALDAGVGDATRRALSTAGLTVEPPKSPAEMGGAQVIQRLPSGALMAGADPRREAYAIAW